MTVLQMAEAMDLAGTVAGQKGCHQGCLLSLAACCSHAARFSYMLGGQTDMPKSCKDNFSRHGRRSTAVLQLNLQCARYGSDHAWAPRSSSQVQAADTRFRRLANLATKTRPWLFMPKLSG